ncbi:hypothetical protein BCR44DRAFT_1439156 [Catenaria anguillulae PL171]|uniref:BTB domain-containing protein n=1 Tax=Catenaria anguillulae PL171 TaxID=765915 RepID=A0A1Y2HEF0_9FUNG|nr:hypothetical protein BCR44DRAFT_1439156 [Catenaria anguillulae PL171]
MLAVRNVSISAKSGLRFAVTIGYDLGDGSPGYCPWQPAAVSVESINNQSVISFALPSLSYNSVRVKQVTVKVEQVDPPQASSIPAAIQQLRTNALLATMDNPTLCDCSLLPKDALAKPIHVSRAVLAHASTYFVTMFSGPWADAGKHDKPIELGWTVSAVLPSLIHIYSGWVVGQPLPPGKAVKELVAKHGLDVTAFTLHQLLELMDLAQMLELPLLVQAVNKEMTKLLAVQLVKVSSDVVDMCKKVKEIGNEAEE